MVADGTSMTGQDLDELRELIRRRVEDPRRLAAVEATALLDSAPEGCFDRIAHLAATVLGTPWAFVTLVDEKRSFWKACVGLGAGSARQNPVEESFCQYVIGLDDALLVEDVRLDARTADNPSIGLMGVVAWAGHPVRDADGAVLGTVCAVDDHPRAWSDADAQVLAALAEIAGDEIRLRAGAEAAERTSANLAELAVEAARTRAVLGTVLDRAPVGFALLGPDLRYVLVNDALAEINGLPADDHAGRRLDEVVPHVAPEAGRLMQQVLDLGDPVLDVEHTGETPARPGERRSWLVSYYRIEAGDEVVGVASLVQDVTEQRRQERRLQRLIDGLFTFVALLGPGGDMVEVNQPALDAGGLSLDEVRGTAFWDAYWWSHSPEVQDQLRRAVDDARAGHTVRYDVEVRTQPGGLITIDFQLVPLIEGGRVTALVASGLDISERLASRRRSEMVAQLARRLTCATTTGEAARTVAEHGPATLGAAHTDVALVDWQRGVVQVLAPSLPDDVVRRYRELPVDAGTAHTETIRSGRAVLVRDRDERSRRYPGTVGDADRLGLVASVTAPLLRSDGSTFGAIGFGWTHEVPELDPEARAALETVADLCAQTLVRTLTADASHDLLRTMQDELLAGTPEVAGLDVAVRYQPAARELGFGGDWYEVVPLDDRRTAIIVGDVAGHGVAAAARMAQVRTVLSTLVQLDEDVGGLFDRAERLIERSARPLFATVSVVIVDTAAGEVVVLSAGHPPPVVVDPAGTARVVEPARRPLLGVPGPRLRPVVAPFPPGALLVSFTDGLVERRGESLDDGLARLAHELASLAGDASSTVADSLLARLVDHHHGDDVALAVVRHRR